MLRLLVWGPTWWPSCLRQAWQPREQQQRDVRPRLVQPPLLWPSYLLGLDCSSPAVLWVLSSGHTCLWPTPGRPPPLCPTASLSLHLSGWALWLLLLDPSHISVQMLKGEKFGQVFSWMGRIWGSRQPHRLLASPWSGFVWLSAPAQVGFGGAEETSPACCPRHLERRASFYSLSLPLFLLSLTPWKGLFP